MAQKARENNLKPADYEVETTFGRKVIVVALWVVWFLDYFDCFHCRVALLLCPTLEVLLESNNSVLSLILLRQPFLQLALVSNVFPWNWCNYIFLTFEWNVKRNDVSLIVFLFMQLRRELYLELVPTHINLLPSWPLH